LPMPVTPRCGVGYNSTHPATSPGAYRSALVRCGAMPQIAQTSQTMPIPADALSSYAKRSVGTTDR
jgi:hypothetical protein